MRKVGLLIAHPPREEGFFFSGSEILLAAEQQLECAGGLDNPDTPFVTVKVTLDSKVESNAVVEGYQVCCLIVRVMF